MSVGRPGRRRRPSAPRWQTTSASSPGCGTRLRRSVGYRDWFALSLATDEMDEDKLLETLAAADRVTAEPFARWKSALDGRLAERFGCDVSELGPWHYADPFFQEPPPEGSIDLDPLFKGKDVVALARRTFEGVGFEVAGDTRPQRPVPAAREEPARVLHRHRPQRGRSRPRQRDRQPQLDGHDAPRARPRRIRPGIRRRPALAAARHAPRDDRGLGAPVRRSGRRPRVAGAGARASRRTRRTSSKDDCVRRGPPSSSSSPAGFSS